MTRRRRDPAFESQRFRGRPEHVGATPQRRCELIEKQNPQPAARSSPKRKDWSRASWIGSVTIAWAKRF